MNLIENIAKDVHSLENKFENNKIITDTKNFVDELRNTVITSKWQHLKEHTNNADYEKYWNYLYEPIDMDQSIGKKIGLSRWDTDVTYSWTLWNIIDDTVKELSKTEGTLYKHFDYSGNNNELVADKYENGKKVAQTKVNINLSQNDIKKLIQSDNIFQISPSGKVIPRKDLDAACFNISCEKSESLKEYTKIRDEQFGEEGHTYQAFEDDGYIFLQDMTNKRKDVISDMEFELNEFQGEGTYVFKDGKYTKISDELHGEDLEDGKIYVVENISRNDVDVIRVEDGERIPIFIDDGTEKNLLQLQSHKMDHNQFSKMKEGDNIELKDGNIVVNTNKVKATDYTAKKELDKLYEKLENKEGKN